VWVCVEVSPLGIGAFFLSLAPQSVKKGLHPELDIKTLRLLGLRVSHFA
jgi:hypothetical protein